MKNSKARDSASSEENTLENSTTAKMSKEEKGGKKNFDPHSYMENERRKLLVVGLNGSFCRNWTKAMMIE